MGTTIFKDVQIPYQGSPKMVRLVTRWDRSPSPPKIVPESRIFSLFTQGVLEVSRVDSFTIDFHVSIKNARYKFYRSVVSYMKIC